MKVVIVGLGIQGKKRLAVAGGEAAATVDPLVATADFPAIADVPLERYDAAIVSTPDQQKIEVLSYLLSQGKHVLVEKPLTAGSVEQLRQLDGLANQTGAACITAYNHRFEPNLVRLKELVDAGTLGDIYQVRMFYGNGTAADVRRSPWRDRGLGVLADLGSHLLDLTDFIFNCRPNDFEIVAAHCCENQAYDHVQFIARRETINRIEAFFQYEVSLLSWRNSFAVDVLGKLGSAHVSCLCKWGPSSLTYRKRVFPSGRPSEEVHVVEQADPTWEAEYRAFQGQCRTPVTTIAKDIWINTVLSNFAHRLGQKAWVA